MAKMSLFNSIGIGTIGVLCLLQAQPVASQEKRGVIPHAPLLKSVLPDTANQEVAVYETEYAPGGINPRHLHPAAITFHVLSGAGVSDGGAVCRGPVWCCGKPDVPHRRLGALLSAAARTGFDLAREPPRASAAGRSKNADRAVSRPLLDCA